MCPKLPRPAQGEELVKDFLGQRCPDLGSCCQDGSRSPPAGCPDIPATGAASGPQEEPKTGRREEGSVVTSERLVQVLLAEDDVQVVHGARVELNAENHVAGRAAKLLVVALELREERG